MFFQALFHKQHSDESDIVGGRQKTKLSNIVVECQKTGDVVVLSPESLDQPSETQKWEKCKLALVKTVGGYLLEFYSPPNAKKVRFFFFHIFYMPSENRIFKMMWCFIFVFVSILIL